MRIDSLALERLQGSQEIIVRGDVRSGYEIQLVAKAGAWQRRLSVRDHRCLAVP